MAVDEVKKRLLKVSDLAVHPAVFSEGFIRVVLNHSIENGSEIKFKVPPGAVGVSRLLLLYEDTNGASTSQTFTLTDANGNDVGNIKQLFTQGTILKVLLDTEEHKAFCTNADTNAYLEARFAALTDDDIELESPAVTVTGNPIEITDFTADGELRNIAITGTEEETVNVYVYGKNCATLTGSTAKGITSTVLPDGGVHITGTLTGTLTMTIMPTGTLVGLPKGAYSVRWYGSENAPDGCSFWVKNNATTPASTFQDTGSGAFSSGLEPAASSLYISFNYTKLGGVLLDFTVYPYLASCSKANLPAECDTGMNTMKRI
jgi:hypothetical protein